MYFYDKDYEPRSPMLHNAVGGPDTMIPIEDVPGFYDVMGRNTDYICVPEECLAENFSFLISYGFFGRYDLTLDTRKVLFVPYATPALIRSIHATLMEHFPGR